MTGAGVDDDEFMKLFAGMDIPAVEAAAPAPTPAPAPAAARAATQGRRYADPFAAAPEPAPAPAPVPAAKPAAARKQVCVHGALLGVVWRMFSVCGHPTAGRGYLFRR